jgi:hypothetical protein
MIGQVQVHNLMSKEDLDLVTLGYRFYLYDNTHVGRIGDLPCMYCCSWFERCTLGNLKVSQHHNVSRVANSKCTSGNEQNLDFGFPLAFVPLALVAKCLYKGLRPLSL